MPENDGEILIPISGETQKMSAIDLPPNVAAQLQMESVGNIQIANADARASAQTANAVLRFAAGRKFDELGPTESRSVSGVLATPVASPTTQQG